MQETKSLKDLACNVLNRSKSNAKPQQRITLAPQHQNQNLENKPESRTDNTDRFNPNANVSVLSVPSQGSLDRTSLLDNFEERLAIAEYDGHQSPIQAQRIAYQDAFIAVLNTLPYEEEEGYYDEDWLTRRIKAVQNWLVAQGLRQPE